MTEKRREGLDRDEKTVKDYRAHHSKDTLLIAAYKKKSEDGLLQSI
jgi:hypothetical protein